MLAVVWQAITFLGLIIIIPIAVAALLGRRQKRDIRKDAQPEK